ncbi:hypothetical protein ERX46_09695 [Brumimicrobium glaciale]|uniref:Uncharacterized protein n=1 Tax=Brumimicrobium glaciale TaxID=200475 RepID=A0A4Q4KM81_9FLAO|nr:hypothetical protein [Brumimicrobium glaciale]RYM34218.1 hypothetical protein ERX46_09695 [Brumimicrobium glaciale]
MKTEKNTLLDNIISISIGAIAVLSIKSIFDNDNSKIVSEKGRRLLSDDIRMKEINKKILESGSNEVFV